MKIDLSSFKDAIARLADALDIYNSEESKKNPRLRKHLWAGAIQAFEYNYEIAFKMLKRYLKKSAANPAQVDGMSFNEIIRAAWTQGLLRSELETWQMHRTKRGTTSHTYNEGKAQEVFEGLEDFLQEIHYLYQKLEEKNQKL